MLTTAQPRPTCHSSSAREVARSATAAMPDPTRIVSRAPRVSIQRPATGPEIAEINEPSMNATSTGKRRASPSTANCSASAGM